MKAFLGLTFLFVTTRLTNLTLLPVFNDEAVYLNWARMIADGEASPFISVLADNKKPLQIWLISLNIVFFDDPLVAGRLASICAGAIAALGIYFSGTRLFSSTAGLLAVLAYILCPYSLLFDRQAQESSLLSANMAWSIWLSITLIQRDKVTAKHYVALILTTGLGLLTLSTALLFVFIPIALRIIHLREKDFAPWSFLVLGYGFGLIIAITPYVSLYLTTKEFQLEHLVFPKTHWLGHSSFIDILLKIPSNLWNGLNGVNEYFWTYLTPMVCFLAGFGLFKRLTGDGFLRWILPFYFFIPVVALLGGAGSGFSRYYVFCAVPLFISAGGSLSYLVKVVQKRLTANVFFPTVAGGIALVFCLSIMFDLNLIFKPSKAPYVERDIYQFVTSQFSGFGVPEAIDYLEKESHGKKIAVFTTSNWGNPADAVFAYLSNDPDIELYSAYWVFTKPLLPPKIKAIDIHQRFTGKFLKQLDSKNLSDVYFIRRTSPNFSRDKFIRANPNLQPLKFFSKPGGKYFVEVYKILK